MGLSVENATASILAVGTLVHVSGVDTTTGMFKVTKADADGTAPANVATYIVTAAIPATTGGTVGYGRVARAYTARDVNTSAWTSAGDPVYLSTTAGLPTPTAPTGTDAIVQRVGYVRVKSTTVGIIDYDLSAAPIAGASTATLLAANNAWTGTNSYTVTRTTAGTTVSIVEAMNSATANSSALNVEADQTTTARTAGALNGINVDITSLAGDLNGVMYNAYKASTPTDGGGTCFHNAFLVKTGNDYGSYFEDSVPMCWGTGAANVPDIKMAWDGTRFNVTQLTADSEIRWGVDDAGIDHVFYGDTASANMTWDQSADALIFSGIAKIKLQTLVAATGATIPVTHSGSFPITQNGAETNSLAIPTFLGQQIDIFVDTDTSGARVITSAQRINQAANTVMTLTEVGDFIRLVAISIGGALRWQVVANDGVVLS